MSASAGGQTEKGLRQQVEQLFADTDESVTLTVQVLAGIDCRGVLETKEPPPCTALTPRLGRRW